MQQAKPQFREHILGQSLVLVDRTSDKLRPPLLLALRHAVLTALVTNRTANLYLRLLDEGNDHERLPPLLDL